MERRNFLKNLGVGVAIATVPIKPIEFLAEEKALKNVVIDMNSLPNISPEEIFKMFQQTGVLYYKDNTDILKNKSIKP